MKNLFDGIPADLPEELFQTLLEDDRVRIERIVSHGHASSASEWYDQQWREWVLLLRGRACLVFDDGREIILQAGDYLDIPAHQKHRVAWTEDGRETIWLAVHFT